jgi:hypothetical protein
VPIADAIGGGREGGEKKRSSESEARHD